MEKDREKANIGPESPSTFPSDPSPSQKEPKRRIIGRRAALANASPSNPTSQDTTLTPTTPRALPRTHNRIPASITENTALNTAITSTLPRNYNFEIHKTIHRIQSLSAKCIALQFPEGLLMFAPLISDILTTFCPGTDTVIMGDVTYGACCIDDYTASALGADLLVHYGHSCLVPMDSIKEGVKTLYVFVTIGIDTEHLIRTVERNFEVGKRLALVGTIQFNGALTAVAPRLREMGYEVILPRSAPLSAGEILGCTAPTVEAAGKTLKNQSSADIQPKNRTTFEADTILYIGDGRFHLEAILISSPSLRNRTYRYDPYTRRLTHETYGHGEMHSLRRDAINAARRTLHPPPEPSPSSSSQGGEEGGVPRIWGFILGTLGRQGNPHTLDLLKAALDRRRDVDVSHVTLLLSEITPQKLALMSRDVGVWVQIACPRLSVDWGYAFERPLLSAVEAGVVLGVGTSGVSDQHREWADRREAGVGGSEFSKNKIGGSEESGNGGKCGFETRESECACSAASEEKGEKENEVVPPVYPMDYYSKDGMGRVKAGDVSAFQDNHPWQRDRNPITTG